MRQANVLPIGKLPSSYYRVSVKAVISDDQGRVLCVKEGNNMYWSLPGGGIDFGETLHHALNRELQEEVGFEGDFSEHIVGVETFFAETRDVWKMSIIAHVVPDNFNFSVGNDASGVAFRQPQEFAGNVMVDEEYIYKYGMMLVKQEEVV